MKIQERKRKAVALSTEPSPEILPIQPDPAKPEEDDDGESS